MIVNDLFIVQPMSSFSGYITYMQYALGTEKGGVGGVDAEGNPNTVIQDPFVWSAMTEERSEYTGENVVDTVAAETASEFTVSWTPVVKGIFENGSKDVKVIPADGGTAQYYTCDANGKITASLKKGDRIVYK